MESEDQDQSIDCANKNNRLIEHYDGDICISNSNNTNLNKTILKTNDIFKDWNEVDIIVTEVHSTKKVEDINLLVIVQQSKRIVYGKQLLTLENAQLKYTLLKLLIVIIIYVIQRL
ncbi:30398_t:CDS:2 [Gigaspora margarita]|uniref:30398_t:CDS:1 n=1 Tax=Gigaspora margarita TaxID=4874 RepID=A0ABN7W9H3_GIGMA|nr:30398_t:CDS:2 [Gigaspora margarita]